jgi:hypothetical protein
VDILVVVGVGNGIEGGGLGVERVCGSWETREKRRFIAEW